MTLDTLIAAVGDLARPFTVYAGGAAVAVGVFVPSVSADKLWIAAAMAGVVGVARSLDNQAQIRATAEVDKVKAAASGGVQP
ncbi:MAG: hypothetical protein ACYDD1_21125 [Caulobacteraceae bacterium]